MMRMLLVRRAAVKRLTALTLAGALAACASNNSLLTPPAVDLTSVEVSAMTFTNQTFLLGFNVSNPNPVPLPVRSVKYRVFLNDENFAGGETLGNFTVPARGDEDFVISVDLNLLQSGAQLTSIIRSGVKDNVNYEVHGDLAVDLPLAPTLSFSNAGTIMVQSELF